MRSVEEWAIDLLRMPRRCYTSLPCAPCRHVVLSLKVRLSLQVCRCEFSAAFHGRPNEQGQSSTITPVLIPFLRTVYSVVQFRNSGTNFGGTFAGFQLRVMLHLHKGWILCFSIHFAVRSCSVWSRLR